MKILLIIVAIAIVALIINSLIKNGQTEQSSSGGDIGRNPGGEKVNDKIIMVTNVNSDDIKKALTGFCNVYNKGNGAALPRLWQISSNAFAITFPYDIDFATYCFAVNFLKYPMDIKWNAEVRAWATTKPGDDWVADKTLNKKVMLYLAKNDKEYDNVFLTTEDGIGYKLGFASGHEKQLLNSPLEAYIAPSVNVTDLADQKHEDFK